MVELLVFLIGAGAGGGLVWFAGGRPRLWPERRSRSQGDTSPENGSRRSVRRDEPVGEGEVRSRLAAYSLSEAELEHLCAVIDTQRKLDEMVGALRSNMRNKLKNELQKRSRAWQNRSGYDHDADKGRAALLLTGQAIAGPDCLHRTFAGLERDVARFSDEFAQLLMEAMPPSPMYREFRAGVVPDSRTLTVKGVPRPENHYLGVSDIVEVDLTREVDEHQFWTGVARKLVADRMANQLRLPKGVLFDVDVGALTKFASNLSTSAPL
jgi:hypothetical protein